MGYTGDISLLSKFRKSFFPLMWNKLFTLLFKSLSKRVTGSKSASKVFYTLIYGLYNWINLDYGSVLWTQFVQSAISSTRHTEISYARFWRVVVNRDLNIFKVPLMKDSLMAGNPTLQKTTFVMSDPRNFKFVSSIPDVMLEKVPLDNSIFRDYRKFPSSGVRPTLAEL